MLIFVLYLLVSDFYSVTAPSLTRSLCEWVVGKTSQLEGLEPNLEVVSPLQAGGRGILNNLVFMVSISSSVKERQHLSPKMRLM